MLIKGVSIPADLEEKYKALEAPLQKTQEEEEEWGFGCVQLEITKLFRMDEFSLSYGLATSFIFSISFFIIRDRTSLDVNGAW